MLVALAPDGFTRSARWARRDEGTFHCPECGSEVVLKAGRIIATHFAHKPGSPCHYGEGESIRHLRMKAAIERMWEDVRLEVVVLPDRRADAIVTTPNGGSFVVECQASSMTADEMIRRTCDYAKAGYPVMWVWDVGLMHETHSRSKEWRSAYPIQLAHDFGRHRAYVMDHHDRLLTIRMEEARERTERYLEEQDMHLEAYVPKSIRRTEFQFADVTVLDVVEESTEHGIMRIVVGREPWKFPGTDCSREMSEAC